tara:strand:- start:842 stop:1813 length:972 start_codon:yes stop_codon:yes gene_type:complete
VSYLPLIAGFVTAILATRLLVSIAPRLGFVDVPNERSMHVLPVPTIGGMGLLFGVWVALMLYPFLDRPLALSLGVFLSGVVLSVLVIDERHALPWRTKLLVQVAATVTLLVVTRDVYPSLFAAVPLAILLYTQNLYNFLDGLDGLSGLVGCMAGAIGFSLFSAVDGDLAALSLIAGAASLGFVIWNVPPARIFMGDVGAHYLGLIFGWIALVGTRHGIPVYIGLLPIGAFMFDGTYTLIRRLTRGDNVTQAHRYHLYQRLHRSGCSAVAVDSLYVLWTASFGALAMAWRSGSYVWPSTALVLVASLAVTIVTEVRWSRMDEYH